ncbi:MAG: hypothetical protein ACD_80C00102G0008 [uncultured bacterium (gcode 4)]|uniref:Uncharacterized protein n=1 Tax=uncultured bacterium (gcode 4) TaxID=1234023 RepID=K1XJ72_9BACT|nr:MAG: hypothetical protein ACD_80C00102G0008 [uncultured bacterium (gcode 4)]
MKSPLLLLLLVSFSFLLSGCGLDESFESNQQNDGDDINIIQDVWSQALDQMLQSRSTPVVWSQSFSTGTVSSQISNQTVQSDPSSFVWDNTSESEDDSESESD